MSDIGSIAGTQTRTGDEGLSRLGAYLASSWLVLLSASMALAVTVAIFDRTTLSGVSRQWLASWTVCFLVSWVWWARPRLVGGRLSLARYQPVALVAVTSPLLVACALFVSLVYASEDFHNRVRHLLYYERLLSDSTWPVTLFVMLFVASLIVALLRRFAALMGTGAGARQAAAGAVQEWPAALPWGIGACGLLLSSTALMMINVNFWRYWATADGWTTIGHYIYTMSDITQVVEGGVAPYFISFPLLPAALVASYQVVGHNTLASYLPIVVANTLLPVGVFLALREITGNHLTSLLFAFVAGAFPLLRNYSMDVGEADSLLMASVVFAAYLRVKANRPRAGTGAELLAGLSGAVAAFARPEGILYVGPMYAASLPVRWRSRRYWLSVAMLGIVVAAFAGVSVREFGVIWPGNHSGTIALSNFLPTLEVASRNRVFSMYAQAFGVSDQVLAVMVTVVLAAVVLSALRMLRKDIQLAYMPVMALANVVMVLFVGPIPAEASKFHDFFRHMSYGFPLLVVTLGYGFHQAMSYLDERWSSILRPVAYLGVAMIVLAELALLEGPVTPGAAAKSPLMTTDVHVSATQLLVDPYALPVMKFRKEGARYIPDMPEYMATYPDDVYRYYEAVDVRRWGNAFEYYDSARFVFLALLVIAGGASLIKTRTQQVGFP